MWLLILIVFAVVVGAVIGIVGGGMFGIIGIPLGLLLAAGIVAWMIARGRDAPQVVSAPPEPTGVPRSASADAETSNERVGQ